MNKCTPLGKEEEMRSSNEVFRLKIQGDSVALIREYVSDVRELDDLKNEHEEYVVLEVFTPISHKDIKFS